MNNVFLNLTWNHAHKYNNIWIYMCIVPLPIFDVLTHPFFIVKVHDESEKWSMISYKLLKIWWRFLHVSGIISNIMIHSSQTCFKSLKRTVTCSNGTDYGDCLTIMTSHTLVFLASHSHVFLVLSSLNLSSSRRMEAGRTSKREFTKIITSKISDKILTVSVKLQLNHVNILWEILSLEQTKNKTNTTQFQ